MSIPTPNYMLNAPYSFECGQNAYDTKTLPEGTFVRPIEIQYVPAHILDNKRWRSFNSSKEIFCYTHYGIIPIPREKIRKL